MRSDNFKHLNDEEVFRTVRKYKILIVVLVILDSLVSGYFYLVAEDKSLWITIYFSFLAFISPVMVHTYRAIREARVRRKQRLNSHS